MDIAVYHEFAALEDWNWWFRARREILRRVLRRCLRDRKDLRVLEVGSGTGGNLNMLSGFGTVWALEPHLEARRLCVPKVKKERATLLEGSVPEADLAMRFDLICLLDVLEHIPDDRSAVTWIDAHLDPGGIVLLTVPAFQFLWGEHDAANHHQRRYTRKKLIEVCGCWRPRHVTYYNTLLFPPIATLRLVKRILRRRGEVPSRSEARASR